MRSFVPFVPNLAGATMRGRLLACLGALVGVALTSLASAVTLHGFAPVPFLVAPIGASAVLVFAVPASPLAQPWSVIGGNVVSALVGVTTARYVPVPFLGVGIAVGGAIVAMSLLRCLHPPGGAAALTAVMGGLPYWVPATHSRSSRSGSTRSSSSWRVSSSTGYPAVPIHTGPKRSWT